MNTIGKTKKLALLAVLTALALALSYTERFIPLGLLIPLPGVKLGLANIVTVFALYRLGEKSAAATVVARCFLGSLFSGGLSALCFSLSGGLFSLVVMTIMSKSRIFSVYGICLLGAAFHNVGQICAAAILLNNGVFYYLPWLLAVALITGGVTGAVSSLILRRTEKAVTGGAL